MIVRIDPRNCGNIKQSANALGITNVGMGQKWRVAREMKDVFSANMFVNPGDYGPHSVKPLACHHLEV